ncbi:hypothetical protein [Streptomyces sp. NPDC047928]|uniref:hypothetical protein n=1 Tax=unclassified Streptomyces TaxID=2593676 RepID=UPI0037240E57
MSVARRPLLTATAAGTLLCALWFVPSANATGDQPAVPQEAREGSASASTVTPANDTRSHGGRGGSQGGLVLADTGSMDTTPYLVGGTALLGLGAGLVTFAVRRGARAAL